ncbi:MAG: response regulator [Bryobacterales bacterium]|nr:response regulator [Bryobacterales bacterium]
MATDSATETLLAEMAGSSDLTLEKAPGTEAGLAKIEASDFGLVVLDISGLGLGGLALLHQIRQTRPALKVLVVTAETAPATVIYCLREQVYGYFSKPFLKSAVEQFVRQALASQAGLDEIEVLSGRPEWMTFRIRCRPETADRLVQFLREMKIDLPPGEREDLATAFHEVIMNAIEHGAQNDPGKELRIGYLRSSRSIIYYVQDPGRGFKLDELQHAAISNDPESPAGHLAIRTERGIRPGGFGILMARNLVDEMIYNEKGNEVILIKYLKESPSEPEGGLS